MKGNLPYIIGGVLILGVAGFFVWKKNQSVAEEKSASDMETTATETTSSPSSASKTTTPSKVGSYLPSSNNMPPIGGPSTLLSQDPKKRGQLASFAGAVPSMDMDEFAFKGHTF